MNRELAAVYRQAWYDNSRAGLDSGCLARIDQTKRELRKNKYPDDLSQVVASLSFGL
ncbi:MAG: hypothetical protein OXC26_08570 [Albidovulum sp.]|nr:hypothetical protein [Albidovulum sp.]